jgi:26S proteasome regulatory subunit T5
MFLPVVGLVDPDKLQPGDLIGVNKDSFLILDMLPAEYDSRVKAMEVCSNLSILFLFLSYFS